MTEKTETIKKILRTALRIVRTALYIAWLLLMLLFTIFLIFVLIKGVVITETDIYMEFNPYTYVYLFGWIFSVLNIETALVLLRKYSKFLGVFHILLGFLCLVLTFVIPLYKL